MYCSILYGPHGFQYFTDAIHNQGSKSPIYRQVSIHILIYD